MTSISLLFVIILLQFPLKGFGEIIKSLMYENIESTIGCYRRLNGTHQIGCSSKHGGSTGIIHFCKTHEDLTFILENGKGKHYIPILPATLFDMEILDQMIKSQKVSGLMLILCKMTKSLPSFTHESQCPNLYTSLKGTCRKNYEWNPFGTGLLQAEIPFPVFYTDDAQEIMKMSHCFQQFNNFSYESQGDRSLCSLEMKAFMYATKDTVTCQRHAHIFTNLLSPAKLCDPLGDRNLWVGLYPLVDGTSKTKLKPIVDVEYIVIAAKLDTTTLLKPIPGANSPITGIVTVLSVAKYLKAIITTDILRKAKMNVLFILFNGESYDYIGSQRILYDMLKGDFPTKNAEHILPQIHPDNISLYIELNQLGKSKDNTLYVHHLNKRNEIKSFYEKLVKNGEPHLEFRNIPGTNGLPPASLHTFLKKDPAFPGLIIADHKSNYSNQFYNSMFDNSANIAFKSYGSLLPDDIPKDSLQQFIANISEAIGKSVFEEITGEEYAGNETGDPIMVNELLHCYLENPNCRVHEATQKDSVLNDEPLSFYVGISSIPNSVTTLTSLALGWITGDIVGESNGNCTNSPENHVFKYHNMSESLSRLNSTVCYRLSIYETEAVSPAFIIPDYNWSSGEFSSWTESRWDEMSVRLFLKPSAAHEQMTMALGCLSVIFSSSLVYFLKSKSHILFAPTSISSAEVVAHC